MLDFRTAAGSGVSGLVRTAHSGLGLGTRVLVGRPTWLREEGVVVDARLERRSVPPSSEAAPR